MRMTAELSLYPLTDNFEEVVWAFIAEVLATQKVSAVTNSMSTQVSGEIGDVFSAVETALTRTHERFGKQVLVAKFIPDHLPDIPPTG